MMTMERANAIATIIEENTGLEASAQEVRKGDNIIIGITVGEKGSNIRPNIYPEQFDYLSNEEIADKVVEIYEANKTPDLGDFVNDFMDYEKIKDRLVLCIRKQTQNDDDLKRKYLDMELYVRLVINTDDDGMASVVIKKEHVKKWGVNPQTVIAQARKNSEKQYTIDGMADVLKELSAGRDIGIDFDDVTLKPMYILGNAIRHNGASVINSTKVLGKLAKSINENLYILPSSIHEIIVIPTSFVEDANYLKDMIRCVNDTEVRPDERLSYNLYYFDRETKKVKVA